MLTSARAAQTAPPATPATPAASPASTPYASPALDVDDAGIQRRITAMLRDEQGVYGVVVANADGELLGTRNSSLPFMTASLYKLILMADIYRKIERGDLGQDDQIALDWSVFGEDGEAYFSPDQIGYTFPLQEYLFAAGAYSSNAAAWTLLTLTSTDDLAQTTADIQLTHTYIIADFSTIPIWPYRSGADSTRTDADTATSFVQAWAASDSFVSITTPRDMAIFMQALTTRTLISGWISDQIAAILSQQTVRDRIPALLPAGTQVINKTGNLDNIVNDAGLVDLKSGPRIVVLLSEAIPDDTRATLILQRLALIAAGATEIPPLDVPDPAGLDVIDTTDPQSWMPDAEPSTDTSSDGGSSPDLSTPESDPNQGGD
ncbi:MAG: serine hydrolase [Thermomicrobiales bacterium]